MVGLFLVSENPFKNKLEAHTEWSAEGLQTSPSVPSPFSFPLPLRGGRFVGSRLTRRRSYGHKKNKNHHKKKKKKNKI
jgi:hypothetical protein